MRTSFLVLALALVPGLEAQTCTAITALPATLATRGAFCLTSSLAFNAAGNAITITSNDVTLDFQGFSLRSTTGSNGIEVTSGQNVVIRNGVVTGFSTGIRLTAGRGSIVENMKVSEQTAIGIVSAVHSAIIRDNRVERTAATAIYASGNQTRIVNNDVMFNEGQAYVCVSVQGSASVVQGNRLTNCVSNHSSADSANFSDNVISGANTNFPNSLITVLSGSVVVKNNIFQTSSIAVNVNTGATAKLRDNSTLGVTFLSYGPGTAIDAGDNH